MLYLEIGDWVAHCPFILLTCWSCEFSTKWKQTSWQELLISQWNLPSFKAVGWNFNSMFFQRSIFKVNLLGMWLVISALTSKVPNTYKSLCSNRGSSLLKVVCSPWQSVFLYQTITGLIIILLQQGENLSEDACVTNIEYLKLCSFLHCRAFSCCPDVWKIWLALQLQIP